MGFEPGKSLDEQIVRIFPSNQIAVRHLLFIAGLLLGIPSEAQDMHGIISEDVNTDGAVSVADVLVVLSAFGISCS